MHPRAEMSKFGAGFGKDEHLLDALIDRDPIAAERAMEAHLDTVENRLRGVPVRAAVRE